MACCGNVERVDVRVVYEARGRGWCVLSRCASCGADRRETPWYHAREHAEAARARYNTETSAPIWRRVTTTGGHHP